MSTPAAVPSDQDAQNRTGQDAQDKTGQSDAQDRAERDRAELIITEVLAPSAAEQMQYAFFYVGMLTGEELAVGRTLLSYRAVVD